MSGVLLKAPHTAATYHKRSYNYVRLLMPHSMHSLGCGKGFKDSRIPPSQRLLYSAQGKKQLCELSHAWHDLFRSGVYKCSSVYGNLDWLHKTLQTHTYLSKHVCWGCEMSRAQLPCLPILNSPWLSEEVNTCTSGIFTSLWFGSFNLYQRDP